MRLLAFVLLFSSAALAQTTVTGVVLEKGSGQPLQFASVRVEGEATGSTTDRKGRFTLHLDKGRHVIIASYIGYTSERKVVESLGSPLELTFHLLESRIEMPEFVVTPGDNPALAIIKQAIESKERRKERLLNYRLTSHSKLVVMIDKLDGGIVDVGAGNARMAQFSDSGATAILETQTDAFWARPDRYKEIIKARKQTATIPSRSNILISSFFIIDFSSDLLQLSDRAKVVGPISNAGLRNYDYTLTGTTLLDGARLHVITIKPLNENDPLLEGTLYIADGSFALAMVDVRLNQAAKPTFFKDLRFRQNFRLFENSFWMPTDVVVDASVEISMIVNLKMRIDGFSVLQDYVINDDSTETVFDRTRIKVLKEADERDSLYWSMNQKLINSDQELDAYRRADSMKAIFDETRNDFALTDVIFGKSLVYDRTRVSLPGLLGLYHFNRVEGHALSLGTTAVRPIEGVERIRAGFGYGFQDSKLKWDAEFSLEPADRLTLRVGGFDRLAPIDEGTSMLSEFNTTVSNLFTKYDDKDYFRTMGVSGSISTDPLLLLPLTVTVIHQKYFSVPKSTEWSIARRSWNYRPNPPVNDGTITSFGAAISFDDRPLFDNAGEIRRFGMRRHVPTLRYEYSVMDLSGTASSFWFLSFSLNGSFDLDRFGALSYRLSAATSSGGVPTQRILSLTGSVPYLADSWRFRTLQPREFGGDRRLTLFLENDFGDQIFRWLHIPLLESSGFGLRVFASAGWTDLRSESRMYQTVPVLQSTVPMYEAGFSVDRILLVFRVDFGWRLSHFHQGRNFFVGISTPLSF